MNRWLNRADERLRAWLMEPCKGIAAGVLHALAVLCFVLLMMTRTMQQLSGASGWLRLATCAMFAAPLALMLAFAARIVVKKGGSLAEHLLLAVVCAAAMLMRMSFIDRSAGDYDIYLSKWIAQFGARSFAEGMRANIGEYNVLYQYILFIISRLPVPALYAVKTVTFIGDAFLAYGAAKLAGGKRGTSATAFCAVLLLPTCAFSGGMYAQCDSLYAACALWGLALALEERPAGSAACFALSLAFKLQAVFLLPIVAALWAGRKLRLADALVFLGTLVLVALPALLGGKSVSQIIGIYTAQTGLYNGLNYGAANFFGLLETNGLDVYAYGNFGMAAAFGVLATLLVYAMPRAQKFGRTDYLYLAALMVLGIVFFLPRMHERYFFLAEMLVLALGCRERCALPAAGLILVSSLFTNWQMGVPLALCAAMMLTAMILLLIGWKKACASDDMHL